MIKPKSPLPEPIQTNILTDYKHNNYTQKELAKKYQTTIRQIRNVLYNAGLISHPEGSHYNAEISMKGSFVHSEPRSFVNTLIISDLHAPFIREDYLEFCWDMYNKWNCNNVIFIGDIIDNHYTSFFDTDPDGHSAREELDLAIAQAHGFYKLFPEAIVTSGNHDMIPVRKAFNAGISNRWLKTISEVLQTPGWKFVPVHWINNIMICHGIGRQATTRMRQDMVSVIQGHFHSKSYISYQVGTDRKTFAMQLGCGVDNNSYAMAYNRWFPRPHINCGILLNNEIPIIEYMKLEKE